MHLKRAQLPRQFSAGDAFAYQYFLAMLAEKNGSFR